MQYRIVGTKAAAALLKTAAKAQDLVDRVHAQRQVEKPNSRDEFLLVVRHQGTQVVVRLEGERASISLLEEVADPQALLDMLRPCTPPDVFMNN
jgi:hypothetical protein